MVLVNQSSILYQVFANLTSYVFGSPLMTSTVMLFILFLIALLIRIPLAVAFALLVPMTIVLMALSWLPLVVGGIIIIVLILLSMFTMSKSII